jgi:dTMP kinase
MSNHLTMPFKIVPGCVIVLEGLDATGKTTQHQKMERACLGMGTGSTPLFDIEPLFVHMPSAGTDLGETIYAMTEDMGKELDPLARQMLHLASHAQSVETLIRPALREGRPVILDRWWWSTVAYGYYGARLDRRCFNVDQYMRMCKSVWGGITADLVVMFMQPHKKDKHNTPKIENGYYDVANGAPEHRMATTVAYIGAGDEGEQGEQLYASMVRAGIYRSG